MLNEKQIITIGIFDINYVSIMINLLQRTINLLLRMCVIVNSTHPIFFTHDH